MTALEGYVAFAAGAGVATFLSPCALPLLPGYVGYYLSHAEGGTTARGVALRGLAAGIGAFATLGVIAGLVVAVGQPVARNLAILEVIVGLALVAFGGYLLVSGSGALTVPLPERRSDTAGFVLFGVGYAGASAGCVLPVFLAVVAESLTLSAMAGLSVVATYAGVIAVGLLSATLLLGFGVDIATGRLARLGSRLDGLAGVVLVVAGLGQLVVALAPGLVF